MDEQTEKTPTKGIFVFVGVVAVLILLMCAGFWQEIASMVIGWCFGRC